MLPYPEAQARSAPGRHPRSRLTTLDAEGLFALLGGEKLPGGGFKCRCPAHDDAKPSLSVREDPRTGRVLLNCYAG